MSEWQECLVEDIAAEHKHAMSTGPFGSAISSKFFVDNGVPVIRGGNLSPEVGVRVKDEGLVFVTEEKATEFERSVVMHGDIVFTCWGTINQIGLIDETSRYKKYIISNKQMKLSVDSKKADHRFIYYLFSSPDKQSEILNNGIGAAVPGFNLGQLKKMPLFLPPPEDQRAIADVLTSLDDKIDLLHRQNKTLEAMSETLFRQWFVEDAGDDWEEAKLPDEFDFEMGTSPKGDTFNQDGEGMPMYQGNADFGFRFPQRRIYTTAPKRTAKAGDTLISVRAPVGAQNMASETCCIGRGVAAFRLKYNSSFTAYTYHKLRAMMTEFKQFNAEGTVFGSISKRDVSELPIVLPPSDRVEMFEEQVGPIDAKVIANCKQIFSLETIRDTLLPKLMSGEVRVG